MSEEIGVKDLQSIHNMKNQMSVINIFLILLTLLLLFIYLLFSKNEYFYFIFDTRLITA